MRIERSPLAGRRRHEPTAAATPARGVRRLGIPRRARGRLGHRRSEPFPGDVGLQLLENAVATGSGVVRDHPHVRSRLRRAFQSRSSRSSTRALGACAGAMRPHTRPLRSPAASPGRRRQCDVRAGPRVDLPKHRASRPAPVLEVVATLGLMLVIFSLDRTSVARRRQRQSAPTSLPPISSRAQQASRTPRSASAVCSQTPSPASHHHRYRASWPPRSSVAWSRSGCSEPSTQT